MEADGIGKNGYGMEEWKDRGLEGIGRGNKRLMMKSDMKVA